MKYVYPYLQRTGVCNKLFPWACAVVYAYENGAKMIAPKWTNWLRIGPWLRREKDKRYYLNEFSNAGYASRLWGFRTNRFMLGWRRVKVFRGMAGFFDPFLNKRDIVKAELLRIVNLKYLKAAQSIGQQGFIGVHVRRGDFVTNGQWIPDEWYVKAISRARELVGNLPVKIFSDGDAAKLKGITSAITNASVMPSAPAVQDLLALSYAKALVCTANSTFSMWAVFLGQMPSVWRSGVAVPRIYVGERQPEMID